MDMEKETRLRKFRNAFLFITRLDLDQQYLLHLDSTRSFVNRENVVLRLDYPWQDDLKETNRINEDDFASRLKRQADMVLINIALGGSESYIMNAVTGMIQSWKCCRVKEDFDTIADTLRKIGKPTRPALIEALKDENGGVRREAAMALGEIGDSSAVTALIGILKDRNWEVRGSAAWALGKIMDARAVPPLIGILKDRNWDVRDVAARALGEIGEPALAAVNKGYVYGEIEYEGAQLFYDALGEKLGEGFDKGTIASPKEKPMDLKDDELKRMWHLKRSRRETSDTRRILTRGVVGV